MSLVGSGCKKAREKDRQADRQTETDIIRGSESRLRHVLSELGQWVSPLLRVVHLLRRTHRKALALSGSANGVTVDPATACSGLCACPVPAYHNSVYWSFAAF